MKETALAIADYRVHGARRSDGETFDTTVHFELHKSGAFEYGNQTCMTMKFKDGDEHLYDTRYEKVGVDTFGEYTQAFINDYIADGLKAEPIEA